MTVGASIAITMGMAPWVTADVVDASERFRIQLEGGPVWQTRNDIQIPNDATATRFSLTELGKGPSPSLRLTVDWNLNRKHALRLLLAPLTIRASGTFGEDVVFQGRTYTAGSDVEGTYRFNSWRLTYRYRLAGGPSWALRIGATAKVRDAEVRLEQGDVSSSDTNVGVVPLFHIDAGYRFNDRWAVVADSDLAAAPQGRAIDAAFLVNYQAGRKWDFSFGYRTLEGGADNDDVYTFAWLHYAVAAVGYSF